jgi:ATP/maltotriose-dependent transcriptional regulator MalT
VSSEPIKSPLPGFSAGAQKLIETAIEKNDLEFFYKLYLSKMVELSLTGRGKEFYEHSKSGLGDSPNELLMAKGFEAIGCLIDIDFNRCIVLLNDLEKSTSNLEIHTWVLQISDLCRAQINFHRGNFELALKHAYGAINSPMKSGSLDPIDQGRLIRLVCCIKLILSDIDGINQCAQDIEGVANPDELSELSHAKSAIKSMQLLAQGDYKQAYEIASAMVAIEEELNRVGVSAPFDCKFVVARCLFEFSLIPETLDQLNKLKIQAQKDKLDCIYLLCEVGEIRVLSRNATNLPNLNTKFEALQDYLIQNQSVKSMSWLVDVAEIFIKNANNEVTRVRSLVDRNRNIPYVKLLDRQKYKIKDSELIDISYFKKLPELTAFQIIYKNLNLSKFSSEGSKRQREYLMTALAKGEEVGAREMFLRQDNKTLESIINFTSRSNSQWLESLSRACMERIKERNALLEFSGEQLTQREIEVLKYLTSGKSVEEIGKSLHISKNTMKTHLKNVYRKLKVNDRNEACKIAKTKLLV